MTDWADELHGLLLQLSGVMTRPDVDQRFLARTGVKLDRALFPLLTRIGAAAPIGTVELAALVGRDHSTVSRQVARLGDLGLVERRPSASDGRVRLLKPTAAGQLMLEEFARTRRQLLQEHFSDWSDEERTQVLHLLGKMIAGIGDAISNDREQDREPQA
jgi:DNA-binding MarR family transcriptional regulator